MWDRMKKRLILIVVLVSVIGGIGYFARKGCTKDTGMEYEYDALSIGDVKKTISASGKLDLFDTSVVLSGLNGKLKKNLVDFNQFVRVGDLLAIIDSPEADINLANVTETFKRSQLELDSVKDFYESKKRLFDEKLVSQKEVDEARRTYEKTLSIFNQAKLNYNQVAGVAASKKVYAPVSGVILQRWVEPNQPIGLGKELFIIAPDMTRMKLVINVDESDISYVKNGLVVEFSVSAYPDKVFTGKIMQVRMNPVFVPISGGSTASKVVTYEALVECSNKDLFLRPGMTVTAMVNIDKKNMVLRVPNRAFMISPMPVDNEIGKKYVWRHTRLSVKNVPMERIEVKAGLIGDDFTELKSDILKDGDEVLVGMHKKFDLKGIPDGK